MLEQARRDPELGRCLAQEHALDASISARVQTTLPPPPFLKARLLAQRVTARPVPWWRPRDGECSTKFVVPSGRVIGITSVALFASPPDPFDRE